MTTLITGSGLGLYNTQINPQGLGGNGRPGQSDAVYVNTSAGNLVVQGRDEYLVSLGLDLALVRTYNSQGLVDGDNNDGWRMGVYRSLRNLPVTPNSVGSSVVKVYGDGHEATFTYASARNLYVSSSGEGAHDTLSYSAGTWIFTDGTDSAQEIYDSTGRLVNVLDRDGNTVSYLYTGSLITEVRTTNSDGSTQRVYLDYTGNNLTQLRTVTPEGTETKVRYAYDGSNRLTQVVVDLTPDDNSIADGNTYTTTYTYDGTSTRIASITHSDGSTTSFTYELIDSQWKVKTVTDGAGAVSTLSYAAATAGTPTSANANTANLVTTENQTSYVHYNLNTGALTPSAGNWGTAAALLETGSAVTYDVRVAHDGAGNAWALWRESSNLLIRRFDVATQTCGTTTTLDNRTNAITTPALAVATNGSVIVSWVQSDGTANSIYARVYNASTQTWSVIQTIETGTAAAANPAVAINDAGQAVVVFRQLENGTTAPYNLKAVRYDAGAWQAVETIETNTNSITTVPSADSGPCRPPIPEHAGPSFRLMPVHDSGPCRANRV